MDNTKLPPNTIFTATPVDLDPLEMSPIIFASINNKIPMIKGLIRKGVDVNEINEYGVSALYLACQEGHREIASLLIDAGARVNCVEKSLCTPLHQACRSGDAEIVKLLISKNALLNERNIFGSTPLMLASQSQNLEVIKVLLAVGAKVDISNREGMSPLHFCAQTGNVEIAKLLLEKGSLVNTVTYRHESTPLWTAIQQGSFDVAKELINANADVHKAAIVNGLRITPIEKAKFIGNKNMVKLIQQELDWQRRKPLYQMRLWNDWKENKAHRPTFLGRFLSDKNDVEGRNIREIIATFL